MDSNGGQENSTLFVTKSGFSRWAGGLIADIRRQVPGALNHQRLDKAGELVHEVSLTAGSLLARIARKRILGVNNSHHQTVLEPAEPLMRLLKRWN